MDKIGKGMIIDKMWEKIKAKGVNVRKSDLSPILDIYAEVVKENLEKDKRIVLPGLGLFEVRYRPSKERNAFGKMVKVPPHLKMKFVPNKETKEILVEKA